MTTTCEYTRISLLCSIYHMSNSFNFSLLYLLMVACYNSNTLTVKLVGDDGIEPPQADSKSAALPLCKSPVTKNGAGSENRTHLASLEDWRFTTKLYPQKMAVEERFELSEAFTSEL